MDFSQKTTLKFIKPGVTLSNEIIISFDKWYANMCESINKQSSFWFVVAEIDCEMVFGYLFGVFA